TAPLVYRFFSIAHFDITYNKISIVDEVRYILAYDFLLQELHPLLPKVLIIVYKMFCDSNTGRRSEEDKSELQLRFDLVCRIMIAYKIHYGTRGEIEDRMTVVNETI